MPENKSKSLLKRILSSKILVISEVIVVIFVLLALGKEIVSRHQVQNEINSLKNEIASLEAKNLELTKLTEYFSSQTFKEEQARTMLDMQKQGESVVIVPENQNQNINAADSEAQGSSEKAKISNPQKWWNYFFTKST